MKTIKVSIDSTINNTQVSKTSITILIKVLHTERVKLYGNKTPANVNILKCLNYMYKQIYYN